MDAARVMAALGVVWLHSMTAKGLDDPSMPANVMGRFGVPFFSASAAYLCVEGVLNKPDRPAGAYIKGRVTRLLLPFLIWSVIYAVARSIKPLLLNGENKIGWSVSLLWTGTAQHLWFLPYICGATIALFLLARVARPVPTIAAVGCFVVAAATIWTKMNFLNDLLPPGRVREQLYTLILTADTLPALMFGAGLAFALRGRPWMAVVGERAKAIGVVGGLACVACSLVWLFGIDRHNSFENAAGIGLLFFGLAPFRGPIVTWIAKLGAVSFGIYLMHILFVDFMHSMAPQILAKAKITLSDSVWDVLTFVVAVVASAIGSLILKRIKPLSWLVP